MNAKGRSVEGGKYGAYGGRDGDSLSSVLTREQDRMLRAKAWRHVHRINPAIARRVWKGHRGPRPAYRIWIDPSTAEQRVHRESPRITVIIYP